MLVNSCYVSRGMGIRKVSTAKVTFKVIKGHWQWCHSIGHILFRIKLSLQPCIYLAPFPRYYHLFLSTGHAPGGGRALTSVTDDANRRQRAKQYWPIRRAGINQKTFKFTEENFDKYQH